MVPFKIFVVEDDDYYSELLTYQLSLNPDYEVVRFATGRDFLQNLHQRPSAITLDYSLPDMTCEEVIAKVKAYNADLPIVIVSGQEDVSTAVSLLKEGIYDYIVKDTDTKDRVWNSMKNVRDHLALKSELSTLREEIGTKYDFCSSIKGRSNCMQRVFNLVSKAAKTNIAVSVLGETGTGKELVAKAIHYSSARKRKPFVAVNMAAIPSELIESELFGHEKGAFTGAFTRRVGKFEEAQGGTIFLDEIGEMDVHLQARLLRVLQEREVTRVGGNNTVKIDVRVIVATNKDLLEEVQSGRFREDLFYRLLGLPISLPPLREREDDILLLAKHFVDEFCTENQLNKITISAEARKKLAKYAWPGNVRELKAVMELAAVMSTGGTVMEEDITFTSTNHMSDFLLEETTLKQYTEKIVRHFLTRYDNNVLKVAQKLDIGKSTIYRMLKESA